MGSTASPAKGFAHIMIDIPVPDSTTNWRWCWFLNDSPDCDLTMANKGLGVKGIPIFFTFNSYTK